MLPPHLAKEAAADLGAELMEAAAYEAHRIALGVPRGGIDFIYGDAFPHETDMDQLAGVDFDKGCYVGQEVVSRMEHRGTARNRIVPITADRLRARRRRAGDGGRKTGRRHRLARRPRGLAMLRLDRVADAQAAGTPLTAGGVSIEARLPDWAKFGWPGEANSPRQADLISPASKVQFAA